ncbi:Crp/Fnr family transcriptional regulator [Vibrio makurazakiensis]|uniref:Crp/Fnr family transcriptional regulator n=1 Tax=Vibrio makurazakiensis TaxID=2910250 RepID=UPI003D09EA91
MKNLPFDIQWPCEISDELKQKLLDTAIVLNALPDRTHNKVGGVFYIAQGMLSVSFSSENTNTMNANLIGKNSWMGASMMSSDISHSAVVDELLPLSLVYFPKDKIDKLAQSDFEVYKWLYFSSLETQKDWLQAQICSLYDKQSRVIFSLLEISRHLPSVQGSIIKIDISQRQLSQISGISRPRLNEVLKYLEQQGEIGLERGSIHLLEPDSLNLRLKSIKDHS